MFAIFITIVIIVICLVKVKGKRGKELLKSIAYLHFEKAGYARTYVLTYIFKIKGYKADCDSMWYRLFTDSVSFYQSKYEMTIKRY